MKSIYHYTSIQTLALILRSKTWRFTRLDNLDDLQESENLPYKLAKQVFVACFTFEEDENIPQWKMYSGTRGIRISFNNQIPFEIKKMPNKHANNHYSVMMPCENTIIKLLSNYDEFIFFPHFNEDGEIMRDINFIEVDYDKYENVSKNKANCTGNIQSHSLGINAKHIFALKSNYWSFQKEVRLFVHVLPKIGSLVKEIDFACDSEYLDFCLDPKIFNENISITLGPDCSDADRIIVESLLSANGISPEGKVTESFLKGKVRYKP